MASNRISSDETRKLAGRAIYGEGWLDPASEKDWQLWQKYGPRLFPVQLADGTKLLRKFSPNVPPNLLQAVDAVIGRHHRSDGQGRFIDFWLLSQGFDCAQETNFDRQAVLAAIATVKSSNPIEMIEKGERPTRGPDPLKQDAIKARMLVDLRAGIPLHTWTEEAMAEEYDANRETVRKARTAALSELRQNNSDKTPK